MKKSIAAIVFGILVFLPVICIGDYIIFLKDGNRIFATTYCEKNDIIQVKKYGGTMGIPRALVARIEEVKTETMRKVKKTSEKKEADAVKQEKTDEKEELVETAEKEKKKEEQEKIAKIERFLEEKRQLMKQMDTVTSAFNEAKVMKNKKKKDQCWNELISLQKKFGELRERVMAEYGGTLPAWWENSS